MVLVPTVVQRRLAVYTSSFVIASHAFQLSVSCLSSLVLSTGVSGQAWATYIPAEGAPSDGSKPRGASIFARDFQTVVIYDTQGKFVGVRRPGSGLPIQVC